ncbi:MAG: DUF4402 domain-containing protein [Pacificimonas sp.]
MNAFTKGFAAIVAAGLSTSAIAATTSGTAQVTVVDDITLTAGAALDFGNVVAGTATGAVTVTAANGITSSGAQHLGGNAAGGWTVNGSVNANYSIALPTGSVTLTGVTNNTQTMTVDTFTHSYGSGNGTIGSGNADTFTVGATLRVGAAQGVQAYTGTYDVTVDYVI